MSRFEPSTHIHLELKSTLNLVRIIRAGAGGAARRHVQESEDYMYMRG